MRKVFTTVLVCAFVLALMPGCGGQPQQSTSTPESQAVSEPTSSVAQSVMESLKTDDGEINVTYVGMVFPLINHPWFMMVNEQITAVLEAEGIKVEIESCDNSQAKQLELVENFGEKGVDGLILFPSGTSEIGDTLERLREQGVRVIVFINSVDKGFDGMVLENTKASGEECARIAAAWIDKTFPDAAPGTIEVGVLGIRMNPESTALTEGMLSITEFTDKAKVVAEYEATFNDADVKSQEYTEMMFVEHPNVKCILAYNHPLVVDEVVMRTQGIDLDSFAIFSNTFDTAVIELIGKSRTGESAIRGIAISGTGSYDHIAEAMLGRIEFNEDKIFYEPVSSITAENVEEYLE